MIASLAPDLSHGGRSDPDEFRLALRCALISLDPGINSLKPFR